METESNPAGANAQYETVMEAARSVSNQVITDMRTFAAQQSARGTRLAGVLARLKKNSKTPAATLDKLNSAISTSNALAKEMEQLAGRIEQRPTVGAGDVAFFGQVLDSKGAPVAGSSVQLTDASGKVKTGLPVKTDANGDFSLMLKACELPAGAQNFAVSVQDAEGATVATSESLILKAGSAAYTEVSLKTANPSPKTVTPKPKNKTS